MNMKHFFPLALAIVIALTPVAALAAEADVSLSALQDGYAYSDQYLAVGEQSYALDTEYAYTVFVFEPSEIGKYTFTSDRLIALVSYNGMWVNIEPTKDTVTENTFRWECQSVGQSIMVAVQGGVEAATVSVTWEELVIVEIPWTKYENKVPPQPFVLDGDADDMLYVDTFDGVSDVAVLCNDGYYRLGSAKGPILYACLSDPLMSLAAAKEYGQLKNVIYDGDVIVEKIDYNDAFAQYYECADSGSAMYPLTVDLVAMFKDVGDFQGWYGSDGWIGGNLEDAWMFACYYFEQEEPAFEYGDVNGDGKVNVLDYAVVKSHCMHLKELSAEQQGRADMNGDGKINVLDYGLLKKLVMSK